MKGNGSSFSDVAKTNSFYGAISTAYKYDIINGRSSKIFDPNTNITWQEAMVMIQRAAKIAGYKGSTRSLSAYPDAGEVSGWAVDVAKFVVGSGLLADSNDRTTLNPLSDITCAETADVILKLLRKARLIDIR